METQLSKVENGSGWRHTDETLSSAESAAKKRIFERFLARLRELHADGSLEESCSELNPDIIVISADHTLLFEAQNQRASELLCRRCGLEREGFHERERIRVHPCESRKIIADLTTAGLKVAS